MPAKPPPTCDKVVVGCVVPLRTLHIVKISSTTGERRIARYGRGCVWKIYDSSDHYLGMNQNQVYCVGLVNGEKTVLEYSGPWSLKAKVTSRGAKGWKDLLLSPHRRIPASAPLTLQSGNYSGCGPHFAELSRIKELDLSSTERKLQREKNNFYYVNKSVYVTPTVCENCALLTFRCFTRGVSEKRNWRTHLPC